MPRQSHTDDDSPTSRFLIWERHGQTIMLSVITAALMFASKALWDSNAVQTAMSVRIEHLTTQVAELRGAMNSAQLNSPTRAEFAGHEQRLQALESKR